MFHNINSELPEAFPSKVAHLVTVNFMLSITYFINRITNFSFQLVSKGIIILRILVSKDSLNFQFLPLRLDIAVIGRHLVQIT